MESYMDRILLHGFKPNAGAFIHGSMDYPDIQGTVYFFQTARGVLVAVEVRNLPQGVGTCQNRVYGFHIHSGSRCAGNETDPFSDAGTHFNPGSCQHPHHAGDLPPLFGNHGYAFQIFLTDRFIVPEVLGKTVIIHSMPDDFTSQPAGNAGEKIACGVILPMSKLRR